MRSRIIVTALLAVLIAGDEVLAQTGAPDPPAGTNPSNDAPPTPEHTGWATLARDTAHDFVAFPRRKSTWSLLGIGAAAALATHPADHYVERHVVGNDTAENVFKPGRWVGSAGVEARAAVGLWAIGRYVVSPATDGPRTNKMSHLGFDLMRAQILTQVLVPLPAGTRRPGGQQVVHTPRRGGGRGRCARGDGAGVSKGLARATEGTGCRPSGARWRAAKRERWAGGGEMTVHPSWPRRRNDTKV
jgi:hypothetical protein